MLYPAELRTPIITIQFSLLYQLDRALIFQICLDFASQNTKRPAELQTHICISKITHQHFFAMGGEGFGKYIVVIPSPIRAKESSLLLTIYPFYQCYTLHIASKIPSEYVGCAKQVFLSSLTVILFCIAINISCINADASFDTMCAPTI